MALQVSPASANTADSIAPPAGTQVRAVFGGSPSLDLVAGVVLSVERSAATVAVTSYSPGRSESALASSSVALPAVSPEQAASRPAAVTPRMIVRIVYSPLWRSGQAVLPSQSPTRLPSTRIFMVIDPIAPAGAPAGRSISVVICM